jgi:hypothetical protein
LVLGRLQCLSVPKSLASTRLEGARARPVTCA